LPATKASKLKKDLKATVKRRVTFVATSHDGKFVANGNTELEALLVLEEMLNKRVNDQAKTGS
jgi:hypothetical protein